MVHSLGLVDIAGHLLGQNWGHFRILLIAILYVINIRKYEALPDRVMFNDYNISHTAPVQRRRDKSLFKTWSDIRD